MSKGALSNILIGKGAYGKGLVRTVDTTLKSVKGSVLDINMYIGQSHSPDMARKLRVEFAGAHHESW
jgi:hypothetical protein